jgi:hypothetical protein
MIFVSLIHYMCAFDSNRIVIIIKFIKKLLDNNRSIEIAQQITLLNKLDNDLTCGQLFVKLCR